MSVVALVDCNNFFVSCERVFRPELEGRPVVVMSGNDGCVISRSEEAKALDIPMGAPIFEVRPTLVEHKVECISANHELYVDFSRRVGEVLARHSPVIENYSIDESFLTWTEPEDPLARARRLREEVIRWTGVPVSVGLAPTKTLAKLAADKAKKAGGALSLLDPVERDLVLHGTPAGGVWGIGRRLADRLSSYGVRSALDLASMPDARARKALGIGGLKLAWELRGTPCLALAEAPPARQSVTVSRSFGEAVLSVEPLRAAVAGFASQAAERLRRHGLAAGGLRVYTGWREEGVEDFASADRRIPPTNDGAALVKAAVGLLETLFVEGRRHKKAGIVLSWLSPADAPQNELFDDGSAQRAARRNRAVDRVNAALGAGTLRYAATAGWRTWVPKSERRSPCWTTRWEDLPAAKA
ncbi:MAG: Y-family DNA polymerase [Elusimicrobiota bacterium]|nr:Y-family DNA polymerase [Elusimicrobiota bacterium]